MEYILTAWILTLAYFVIRLTERVKALEDAAALSNGHHNTEAGKD